MYLLNVRAFRTSHFTRLANPYSMDTCSLQFLLEQKISWFVIHSSRLEK